MKILLVDDDEQMARLISRQLVQNNYVVDVAANGEYAIDLCQVNPYGLLLLDIILPGISGIEVCQTLREQGNQTPILMLTGQTHTEDKVLGLDIGADDYLVKPFELDELTARIRALLRRNAEGCSTGILRYGALEFDPVTQILTCGGQPCDLRPKELAILELMLRYPTQIFEPEALLNQLWNLADCPGRATIKTHIRSLRKQLQDAGAHNVIETLYGRGYRLNPEFLSTAENVCRPAEAQPSKRPGPSAGTQVIITQTWEQVQHISWNRLMRLRELVRSLSNSSAPLSLSQSQTANQSNTPLGMALRHRPFDNDCQNDCQEAITLAHQLKGTLGTFGFQVASQQAQHIETLLAKQWGIEQITDVGQTTKSHKNPLPHKQFDDELLIQLERLQAVLAPLISQQASPQSQQDGHFESTLNGSISISLALVISEDHQWGEKLQATLGCFASDYSLKIQICSPLEVNTHLLDRTPTVLVLDLATANERNLELDLLQALVNNYGPEMPIVVVAKAAQKKLQLVALQRGAVAIALKHWSHHTLLSILGEYTVSSATVRKPLGRIR